MDFFSFKFVIFFLFSVVVYYLMPQRYRWVGLLGASYYFYFCWKPENALVLAAVTLADYYIALKVKANGSKRIRKKWLSASIFINLGVLIFYKYLNFFGETISFVLNQFNIFLQVPAFKLLAPLGISYFAFKKISYMIDVYRGNMEPVTHLGKFALYVSFFPEIIAGPIDRAKTLIPQFNKVTVLDYDLVTGGLKLIAWGLFKKIVIADRIVLLVGVAFREPHLYSGLELYIAVLFYSIQIYADFSGYTDIVLGMGRILGIRLMDNFNRPYFSTSISEFWMRWHISLTTWLRDYLFLPIAYFVSGKLKADKTFFIKSDTLSYALGTLVTFVLCGLWHGASWTFVAWGGLHGFWMLISFVNRRRRKRFRRRIKKIGFLPVYNIYRIFITFWGVSVLWVFFRSESIADSLVFIKKMTNVKALLASSSPIQGQLILNFGKSNFAVLIVSVILLVILHFWSIKGDRRNMFKDLPLAFRWGVYCTIVLAILILGTYGDKQFIYSVF